MREAPDPWMPPDEWISAIEAAMSCASQSVTVRVAISAGKSTYRIALDLTCWIHRVDDGAGEYVFLELEEAGIKGERGSAMDIATHVFGRAAEIVLDTRRLDGAGPIREARVRLQVFDGARSLGEARDRVTRAALLGDEDAVVASGDREQISESVVLKCLDHLHQSAKGNADQFIALMKNLNESGKADRDMITAQMRHLLMLMRETMKERIDAAAAASSGDDGGDDVLAGLLAENAEGLIEIARNLTAPKTGEP